MDHHSRTSGLTFTQDTIEEVKAKLIEAAAVYRQDKEVGHCRRSGRHRTSSQGVVQNPAFCAHAPLRD